ncbi:hypothetical protein KIKIMORA_02170 [Brevundimonas phage vB_BpoS-Kikimora]|uniref:Uncharacterized protein n=1 Tax=Brevundimonas phage vB_BpoS-Kikimora TaxID=2948601 RepID=A0A9E7MRM0_9CAUD|nr:hypothetical protein KIKIMORA_02170 [Brevundimonas phage vB_BpoS-Kikimora]
MFAEDWTQDALNHREDGVYDDAFQSAEADTPVAGDEGEDTRETWRHPRLGDVEALANGVVRFELTCDDRAEGDVRKSVEKLNRRMKKWGGEVKITAEREVFKEHWSRKRLPNGEPRMVRQVILTVEAPALAGTERTRLVGSFELAEDGQEIYRHALGDADPAILEPYLKNDLWRGCDHCGFNRQRKATFLCEMEDGSLKLVGRQCSRDFLGLEPGDILARATIYRELAGLAGDEETEGSWGSFPTLFHVESFVKIAYRVAKRYGGYNRELAHDMLHDVAALEGACDFGRSTSFQDTRDFYAQLPEPEPLDLQALCDFVDNMSGDYGANVRIAFSCEFAKLKRKRLVLSGVGVYVGKVLTQAQRAKEEAAREQRQPAKHLDGALKDRLTFRAVVDRCTPFTSQYGYGVVVVMTADDGAKVVHFSTSDAKPEVGKTYAVKATIKSHETDRRTEKPQTVVTRAVYTEVQPGSLI